MKAKEFIPASKPRNPVVRQQQTSGAGAHRDKKKEQKKGYEKHKGKLGEQTDTPEEEMDKTVSDLHKDVYGIRPDQEWGREWMSMTYDEKKELYYSLIDQLEDDPLNLDERVRDSEDWDEGNTEPPNNFAVYINGKKWKVFQGRGQYADDFKEKQHYRQLQDWAQKKSAATGKKWTVHITGEPATESIKEDTGIPFDQCPRCAGPIFHESLMMEKQDACYHKVRSRYKVWPSAYASGALVQCRKKGAKNWGNKK